MNADNQIQWMHPSSWPWFFYIWLVFAFAGFVSPTWNWIQRRRSASWPTADGRIESVQISKPGFSFRTKRGYYVADVRYSYFADGGSHIGRYRREFPDEYEVQEFARELEGNAVAVHRNPSKPSRSALLAEDIDVVSQAKSPAGKIQRPIKSIPAWLRPFLWLLVVFSGLGLVLSLWVHIGALEGRQVAPDYFFWLLHICIFVVWLPAVFAAQVRVGSLQRRDFWKVILADSPGWMRYMVYGFTAYAMINFALFIAKAQTEKGFERPSPVVWRGFSGHWMAFYSAAFAILYTAASSSRSTEQE